MNKKESAIICAQTALSFGPELFSEFHKYVEEKFNRPVWIHEMAEESFWEKLKDLSKNDFADLAKNIKE